MSASLDDLGHIVDVDERTAEARVRAFANAVKAADYNPSDIKRVVSRAADMRTIGINGAPSPETMLESGKRLIDKDVDKAYMAFHVDYTNWGAEFFDKIRTSKPLRSLIVTALISIKNHVLHQRK